MTLGYHGRVTELDEVLELTAIGRSGVDAWSLVEVARQLGLEGEGIRLEDIDALEIVPPGSILHWQSRHYVVLESYHQGRALIVDPAYGRREVTTRALRRNFSGIAVTLVPNTAFQPREGEVRPLSRRQLVALRGRYWVERLIRSMRFGTGVPREPKQSRSSSATGSEP